MTAEEAAIHPLLRFERVSCQPEEGYLHGIEDFDLTIMPGELALLFVETEIPGQQHSPIADLAQGLCEPRAGDVYYARSNWKIERPDRVAKLRSSIGRFYHRGGLISNLDLDENIFLAQLHHTRRPRAEIISEAKSLSKRFGLGGVPAGRPAEASNSILRVAQLIRAFMGEPDLLLLIQPDEGLDPKSMDALRDLISTYRAQNKSVIWWTSDRLLWEDTTLNASQRWRRHGDRFQKVENE